jgi:hypothetical protein
MARTILDDELNSWEAFASTGRYGYAERAQIVFQCTSDPWERPRACTVSGDKSEAEALVAGESTQRLGAMLKEAQPLA